MNIARSQRAFEHGADMGINSRIGPRFFAGGRRRPFRPRAATISIRQTKQI